MNTNKNTPQKSAEQRNGNRNAMTTKEQAAWNRMHGIKPTYARVRRNTSAMADIYQNEWM